MADPSTTQAIITGLSDVFYIRQPEVLYAGLAAMVIVGAVYWFIGHQIHRIFLTAIFLAIGIYVGWWARNYLGLEWVNEIVAMAIGGIVGVGVGYLLFRFWLGLFAALLISLILLSLYVQNIMLPYIQQVREQVYGQLMRHGVELAPGLSQTQTRPSLPNQPSRQEELTTTPAAQAYSNLQAHLPMLMRAKYPDRETWANRFWIEARNVWNDLLEILPHLRIDLFVIGAVSIVIAMVLALVRPVFLDIAYTSLLGLFMVTGAIIIFLAWENLSKLMWLKDDVIVAVAIFIALWFVGMAVQYRMIPSPPPAPEEEAAENGEKEQGGKKKK